MSQTIGFRPTLGPLKLWVAAGGKELLAIANEPDGEFAALDFSNLMAWRYFDPKRRMFRLLPARRAGSL